MAIFRLIKAAAVGGKYLRRTPYTDAKGKRRYRYYYAESAVARDAKEGEEFSLSDRSRVKVEKVEPDGTIHLSQEGKHFAKVPPNKWPRFISSLQGIEREAYYRHAEKRAQQTINAVLRLVPKKQLEDLKGSTDAERMRELQQRVPAVYAKLQKAFDRSGISPLRAKSLLSASLERRGWEPEARAAVIGSVLQRRTSSYRQVIEAAENLAGGGKIEAKHAAAAIELGSSGSLREVASVAKAAEREIGRLKDLIGKAQTSASPEGAAAVLAELLSASATQRLELLSTAFPGLVDRAVEPARETLLEAVSVAPRGPSKEGAVAAVYVSGEGGRPQALQAQYRLMEASEVVPSHDPRTFGKHAKYPAGVQERSYHRDQAEQLKVVSNAQRMESAFFVNTNPDAVNGPPIVTQDGVVLGGNSRTMSLQLSYEPGGKGEEYKKYLAEHAHEVGLKPEDVQAMKNPILVRTVEVEDKSQENMKLLVRQMNESFTQGMDPRTMQTAMGRRLSDQTLQVLADSMGEDESLSDFLASPRSEGFVNALFRSGVIDQRNANQYLKKGSKLLNQDGRTLVARILVGRVIGDADILSDTRPKMVESLARSVPYMIRAKAYGAGYDLTQDLRVALDAYNDLTGRIESGAIPSFDPKMPAQSFQRLVGSFEEVLPGVGEVHPVAGNDRAKLLLETMIRKPGSIQMSRVFKDYARTASQHPEGQASLLGAGMSPEEVLRSTVQQAIAKSRHGLFRLAKAGGHKYKTKRWVRGRWVYEYDEPKKQPQAQLGFDFTAKPAPLKPAVEPDVLDQQETGAPEGTPRGEAEAEMKQADKEQEYVNDRVSAVEQRGEDVKGSARERAMEWKSLRSALESKDAEKIFTRDFLTKQEPINFVGMTQKNPHAFTNYLILSLAMKRFPVTPEVPSASLAFVYEQAGETSDYKKVKEAGHRWREVMTDAEREAYKEKHVAKHREYYYEAFRSVRELLETEAQRTEHAEDPRELTKRVRSKLLDLHKDFREKYGRRNAGLEAIATVHDSFSFSKKVSPVRQAAVFVDMLNKAYPGREPSALAQKGAEHAMLVMEGKSIAAAFGAAKKRGGVNAADFYNTNVMQRKGPPSEYRSIKQGLDLLDKNAGGKYAMRGVQWGKSVTDEERSHHLKSLVDSFQDLSDIVGLPTQAISGNGRLAIAIGARGKAGALAHYEASLDVINITRSKGAGALAHEWGHFFDYLLGKTHDGGEPFSDRTYQIPSTTDHPVLREMKELMMSDGWSAFRGRLPSALRSNRVAAGSKQADYWRSRKEMFARCFERYVQHKLKSEGRENTYLSGLADWGRDKATGLWPTDDEVASMAPHFDRLFDTFKKSELIQKAERYLMQKGGPYIGPKGGKWADPAHTIPWKEDSSIKAGASFPIKTHPKLGMTEQLAMEVKKVEGSTAHVAVLGGDHTIPIPVSGIKNMVNDLQGRVQGKPHSNPAVNAVVSGKAEFLGKGDDGLAFRVGDQVVKVSTGVPYQPLNHGHLSPEAAVKRARDQHETVKALHAAGVPGLLPEQFIEHDGRGYTIEHDGRGYTIKPYVEIPSKLTKEQLDQAHDILEAMHKKGWVLGDLPQVGLHDGKLVMFDVGKARKEDSETARESDSDNMQALYKDHGHIDSFVPRGQSLDKRWRFLHHMSTSKTGLLLLNTSERKEAHLKQLRAAAEALLKDPSKDDLDREMIQEELQEAVTKLSKGHALPAGHVPDHTRKVGGRKLHKRIVWNGLQISVENRKGSTRSWYDPNNDEHGKTTMLYDYGYVRGSIGADGEHVDVYVGPNEKASHVYIVNQMKRPEFKAFDEQKVMLGFDSEEAAKKAYLAHFNDRRFFGSMQVMLTEEFKRKVLSTSARKPLIKTFRMVQL